MSEHEQRLREHAAVIVALDDLLALLADLDAARAERDKARQEALEEAARLIMPTNPPSDWTVYADVCATCANRIRALIEEPRT